MDMWPTLQWSVDEALCARAATNALQIFTEESLSASSRPARTIRVPNIHSMSVAPCANDNGSHRIAVFVPESKGSPGRVSLFAHPGGDAPLANKSFYKADNAVLRCVRA